MKHWGKAENGITAIKTLHCRFISLDIKSSEHKIRPRRKYGAAVWAAALLMLFCATCPAADDAAETGQWHLYREVINDELTYQAVKGDTLLRIAGRFGVELDYLVSQNPQENKYLYPGDAFRITKRTIVPSESRDGIIINIPDRYLYLFRDGKLAAHFPVGLGKPDWKTPTGRFSVAGKKEDPTWHVPASIQREMTRQGEEVRSIVPPGPDNPLGRWALMTSMPGILIHETIAPESVFRFRSHGCIRMRGDDARMLFESVEPGDTGSIVYRPVKLALSEDGSVYLEVQKDVYGLSDDPLNVAAWQITASGLYDRVDWEKVMEVALAREGVARNVTKRAARSNDGQEKFSESGAGTGGFLKPVGGAGKADPAPKHAEPL